MFSATTEMSLWTQWWFFCRLIEAVASEELWKSRGLETGHTLHPALSSLNSDVIHRVLA